MAMHGRKKRLELLMDEDVYELVTNAAKTAQVSKCAIINCLVRQKLEDPLKVIRDKKRELARKMTILTEQENLIMEKKQDEKTRSDYLKNIRQEIKKNIATPVNIEETR